MMKTDYPYLLLDLDGTLSDSAPGITRSAQYALASFGIQVDDERELLPFVGPPLEDSFKEFYHFSDEQARAAVERYHERYKDIGVFENTLYPDVPAFLDRARRAGRKLFVATSKPQAMADKVLRHLGIYDCFDAVVGRGDDRVSRRTKADVIRYVLSTEGVTDVRQAVMIGDRKYDILGARATGLDAVGVLYGYGDRAELEEAGATHIVATLDELADWLGL